MILLIDFFAPDAPLSAQMLKDFSVEKTAPRVLPYIVLFLPQKSEAKISTCTTGNMYLFFQSFIFIDFVAPDEQQSHCVKKISAEGLISLGFAWRNSVHKSLELLE